MLTKTSIYQEGITLINKYAPNNRTPKYTKQSNNMEGRNKIIQQELDFKISHFQKGIKQLDRRQTR